MVPRLCIRNEKIHLQAKPAWIVQTAGGDPNKVFRPFIRFSTGKSRTAVSAEAALVLAARQVGVK
jgi:hypothetical protein